MKKDSGKAQAQFQEGKVAKKDRNFGKAGTHFANAKQLGHKEAGGRQQEARRKQSEQDRERA